MQLVSFIAIGTYVASYAFKQRTMLNRATASVMLSACNILLYTYSTYHTCIYAHMVHKIVPYVCGIKYAYGAQQYHFLILISNTILILLCLAVATFLVTARIETGSGHPGNPGHILSWSSDIKYPGLTRILDWITCIFNDIWQ